MDSPQTQLGVDVGGTTIKGALVRSDTGVLLSEVVTVPTPEHATPEGLASALISISESLRWSGSIGCALPGIVGEHQLRSAPNLSATWNEPGSIDRLRQLMSVEITLLNDADAVGLAEVRYSNGLGAGLTVVLTFGTGIGSALVHDSTLIENSELGALYGPEGIFEEIASGRSVTESGLSFERWARQAQPYFEQIEAMLDPRYWVIGGGLSKSFDGYFGRIRVRSPMRVARLGEDSGIVGAAAAALKHGTRPSLAS